MEEALKTNPILFNITAMHTVYNIEGLFPPRFVAPISSVTGVHADTRALLYKYGRALGWSSLTHQAVYHLPCEDAWADRPECAPDKRVRCPANKHYSVDWCAVITMPGYTSDVCCCRPPSPSPPTALFSFFRHCTPPHPV